MGRNSLSFPVRHIIGRPGHRDHQFYHDLGVHNTALFKPFTAKRYRKNILQLLYVHRGTSYLDYMGYIICYPSIIIFDCQRRNTAVGNTYFLPLNLAP